MKKSILFYASCLGGMSTALLDTFDDNSSLPRRQMSEQLISPSYLQRRIFDDKKDLHIRSLVLPRAPSGRGSPPREVQPGGSSRGERRGSSVRSSLLTSPERNLQQVPAKIHTQMHGPGMFYVEENANPIKFHTVPTNQVTQDGGQSMRKIEASSTTMVRGASTTHATGQKVKGLLYVGNGQNSGTLETIKNGVVEKKNARPGRAMRISATATAPNEEVGLKIESHGYAISKADAYADQR